MAFVRQIALMLVAMAAFCICGAAAETRVYSVHVPGAAKVEASIPQSPDWDVSVTLDAENCVISCEYRRKAGGFGLFLPPVTDLKVYTDGVSNPAHVAIDPAGMRIPRVVGNPAASLDLPFVEGKRLLPSLPPAPEFATIPAQPARPVPGILVPAPSLVLPLRI